MTDVTGVGVGIRILLHRKTDCHDQFANWSRNDSVFCNKPKNSRLSHAAEHNMPRLVDARPRSRA